MDLCKNDWGEWSQIYEIYNYNTGSVAGEVTPVIAPIVTPTSQTVDPRPTNLLGWSIVWAGPHKDGHLLDQSCNRSTRTALYERSWLRVPVATNNTVDEQNGYWGQYSSPTSPPYSTATGLGFRPGFTMPPAILLEPDSACDPINTIAYPTITSRENKTRYDGANDDNYAHEIAFSNSTFEIGIRTISAKFRRAVVGSGPDDKIGSLMSVTAPINLGYITIPLFSQGYERNPSITINSSGQMFVAWERITKAIFTLGGQTRSSIPVVNSYFSPAYPWVLNKKKNIKSIFSDKANTSNLNDWLRNPSVTAFPKSTLPNLSADPFDANGDHTGDWDPAVTEILFWRSGLAVGTTRQDLDHMYSTTFSEKAGNARALGKGSWNATGSQLVGSYSPTPGRYSHRSFGQFNSGPTFNPNSQINLWGVGGEGSAGMGNDIANGNAIVFRNHIQHVAANKGTYPTRLPVTLYRAESIFSDSGMVRFAWADVSVIDTGSAPWRQVMLHFGRDTNEFASSAATRDSIFRTEVFDIPAYGKFSYYRGMSFSDSAMVVSGGPLYDSTISFVYTVELVHANGSIDTLETLTMASYYGTFINPEIVTITNNHATVDDVFLRIRGQINNFVPTTDIDSLTEFEDEQAFTRYETLPDTVFYAYKGASEPAPSYVVSDGFSLLPASPNPVERGKELVSFFSAEEGATVAAALFDILGRQVGKSQVFTATSGWNRFKVNVPDISGTFYLRVSSYGRTKTLVINVK